MMLRALFTLILLATPAAAGTAFHYYGAENCPPCRAFEREYLAGVRAIGAADGFAVHEHRIPDLRQMPRPGVYGPADPLLRAALAMGGRPFPPVFFMTVDGAVISVHGADWAATLLAARDAE
ncbi:MAG: hypothetical protein AAF264_08020 [Pseudomonadota bacterium]